MLCPCGQLTAVAGGCDPRRNFYKFSSVFLTKVSSKPFRAQSKALLMNGLYSALRQRLPAGRKGSAFTIRKELCSLTLIMHYAFCIVRYAIAY